MQPNAADTRIYIDFHPIWFQVLKIQSAQALSIERVDVQKLRADGRTDMAQTRIVGDDWLQSARSLLLEVPSILVPERRNFLINPMHSEMKKLSTTAHYSHPFDRRFFK